MNYKSKKINFGAAYYPEQWPEERWPEDIRLMKEAGFTVVRMGEFAWSTFEPAEGEFNFEWLQRAIDLLAENGILSVLGTPTAAPPAWLTQKYPDTLSVDEYGRRHDHGNRCHYCVNAPKYHEHTQRIVAAMGVNFGSNPNVIGWQFDNEYSKVCYCDTCRKAFQEYLAEKFKTLEALNNYWTTRYWSQTYFTWDQIPIPKGGHNPGLMLAFNQFITASYKKFQKLQADSLRPHIAKDVWVTHNFMKWFPGFDHYQLSEDLDLVSWDWYVPTGHLNYAESGAAHDLVRGYKRRNFWLMETQPGHVNWTSINNDVNQGEARVMAWHAVGHGADAVLYWQWRSALNGQEQYHGTLVDQSGQPRLFYGESAQIGQEFARVSDLLAGTEIQSQVAILHDYNSRWSLDWQPHHHNFDYVQHLVHYYKPLINRNIPVDIISPDEPLDQKYQLVIAPGLVILTPKRVQQLTEYVENGGTLILTIRSGMKDEYNALLPMRQPGPLVEITNVEVEDYYALDKPIVVHGKMTGNSIAKQWAERLRIIDESKYTQQVAQYGQFNGWLDEQMAISFNPFGKGGVYYVGTYLDENAQARMLTYITDLRKIKPLMSTPKGVEVCQRVSPNGEKIYLVINHQASEKKVPIPWAAHEHLSGFSGKGQLTLAPYGIAVLTKAEQPKD